VKSRWLRIVLMSVLLASCGRPPAPPTPERHTRRHSPGHTTGREWPGPHGGGRAARGRRACLALFHTGGTWGSTCVLWMYPETGDGAVVMTNSAGAQGVIRFEILLGIAQVYGWPLDAT
jgi:hypothetical protein